MAGRQAILVLLAAVCARAGLTPSVVSQAAGNVSEKALSCGAGERLLGDSCFYVSSGKYNWYAANDMCKSRGMSLASVHTQGEDDLIIGWARDHTWLGLNDLAVNGRYEWTDGTPVDFTRWHKGQPNGGSEDCVNMVWSWDGEWADNHCDDVMMAACKRPAS